MDTDLSGWEFVKFCREMRKGATLRAREIDAKIIEDAKNHPDNARLFDEACVQIRRDEIHIAANNAKSAINWNDYN